MPSGKQSVSCIPCAKRKVRCDKVQPCCHCKRRRQDTCVFPEVNGVSPQLLRGSNARIEKLEQYIRSLGGDPKHASDIRSTDDPEDGRPELTTRGSRPCPSDLTSTPVSLNEESSPGSNVNILRGVPGESELLSNGEGVTYIETQVQIHDHILMRILIEK